MSGMAILLLCTLQIDDAGWRTSQAQINSFPPAAGSVQPPNPSAGTWESTTGELMQRAQQALQGGTSSAPDYRGPAAGSAGSPNNSSTPSFGGPSGSSWLEVEQALGQPPNTQSRTAVEDSLRNRIRAADTSAIPVPMPPASVSPNTTSPNFDSRWSNAASAGGSSAGFPASSDSFGRSVGDSQRVGQNFPQPPSERAGRPLNDAAGGREVMYEGQPLPNGRPNQRYITPPGRVAANDSFPNQGPVNPRSAEMPTLEQPRLGSTRDTALNLPAPPGATNLSASETGNAKAAQNPNSSRPWGPLLMTVLGLFGSLGFNLYLGWIAWDLYSRYQDAVDDVQELEGKLEAKSHELVGSPTLRSHSPRRTSVASA